MVLFLIVAAYSSHRYQQTYRLIVNWNQVNSSLSKTIVLSVTSLLLVRCLYIEQLLGSTTSSHHVFPHPGISTHCVFPYCNIQPRGWMVRYRTTLAFLHQTLFWEHPFVFFLHFFLSLFIRSLFLSTAFGAETSYAEISSATSNSAGSSSAETHGAEKSQCGNKVQKRGFT